MKVQYTIFACGNGLYQLGLVNSDQTELIAVPMTSSLSIEQQAEAIAAQLDAHGYRQGDPVLLALCSRMCLAAEIATDGLPRSAKPEAMLYRLEEKLPLAAEQFVADFVKHANFSAFAVAADVTPIQPLVEELERRGISIQSIIPTALLVAQGQGASDPTGSDRPLLIREGDQIDLIRMNRGKPTAWRVLPADPAAIGRELRMLNGLPQEAEQSNDEEQYNGSFLNLIGLDWQDANAWWPAMDNEFASVAQSPHVLAAGASAQVILGKFAPWIDLRKGQLVPSDPLRRVQGPLHFALVSGAVLLISIAGSLFWRGEHYRRLADHNVREQQRLFREAFPSHQVPVDVRSRLASEEKRLRGLSGDSNQVPATVSSLSLAQILLSNLPRDLRYRILEVRLDGEKLFLEGEARSHGDAEVIEAAINKSGVLSVDPPKSEQRANQSVAFTMNGGLLGAHEPAGGRSLP